MLRYLPLIPYMATLGLIISLRGPSILLYLLFLPILVLLLSKKHSFRPLLFILFLPFLLFVCIGFYVKDDTSVFNGEEQELEGTIIQIPQIDGDRMAFRLRTLEGELVEVRLFFLTEEEKEYALTYGPGDICQISGALTTPNPPTNFAQFNYPRYLKEHNMYWVLQAVHLHCIQPSTYSISERLQRWRWHHMEKLEQNLSPEVASVVHALVFGDRTLMDESVLEAYQRLGVIHLLAVSGMHVGLVVAASFYLMIRFGITRERALECLIVFLPVYIVIAGAAPSVIRASFMTIVVLLCLRLKQKIPPLIGVTAIYLLYLFLSPYSLFQLGFQLSFLVSYGLLLSAKTIRSYTSYWSQLIAVTMISQLLSLPILLCHVYEIAWLSLPMNLFFIPLITFVFLPLSFIGFIISLFLPITFNAAFYVLEWMVPLSHHILTMLSNKTFATIVVGEPSEWMVVFMYVVIFFSLLCFERRSKHWWKWPSILLLVVLVIQIGKPYVDYRAHVTMIDVGQGDSFLIELPFRRGVYLIDTGGQLTFVNEQWRERRAPFDVGKDIVVPELKQRGIGRLDGLILTHGHADHIGGVEAVVNMIQIDKVLYSFGEVEGELEKKVLTTLAQHGTVIHFVKDGMSFEKDGVTFYILAPVGQEQELNDRSIVLYVELEGMTFLFTGDLEESGERMLLQRYPDLQVDVLKVGHHGSRTSTTAPFLEQLDPYAAFIPVGRSNRYDHPHEEVIERLANHGAFIWRSDQDGAVRLTIHNGKVSITRAMMQ
ncbi:DNA internalization-related competence protein ComEC/Rec2 [Halalkalibacter hemicellulosilyticus]|uniref:Late competence protein n=1 Tax=Halalkalibacter hemicellulosilyticusJCM 9152 TaxID=1236971 RepID=W4QHT0_9BACI|nr:DNA internalization-related competence protein ComEC/Rec2 [Halalkalibacter hemicellulosilyticus]GAE31680.1 late competence protein [Halalkalibacter hemicellulosilyticusJCM 9152]